LKHYFQAHEITVPSSQPLGDMLSNKEDEKISFTTPFGTYCYTKMPKGLKNAGSTFARMTKVVLGPQL